ncbi:MAG: acyl-CoA dehydrogenase [Bradyrhizobium sp.]|nr:acyl-CoA dehydrogenase [Bradyrhizobium sp.]
MDLMPGADEHAIADAASAYLAGELPVARCHRPAPDRLAAEQLEMIGSLGWFGLSLAEAQGGVGLSPVEDVMLFREIGRYLAPVALLTTALAARVAALGGDDALAATLLTGKAKVALLVPEPADVAMWRVFDGTDAVYALAIDDESTLYPLDATAVKAIDCLDKTVSMGLLARAGMAAAVRLVDPTIMQHGTLAAAAMQVGAAEAELDMIVAYAKIRETFGRPIGAYQAVRHPCADMAVRCEAARSQLYAAAVALRDGHGDAAAQVDAAKLLANAAAVRNADSNIQLHGGIAVTMEHDAHLFMKRANLMAKLFGSDRALLDRLVDNRLAA